MLNKIPRRIYYDKLSGIALVDTSEIESTVIPDRNNDFTVYKELAERVIDTVGFIDLEYGQLRNEFIRCSGYRIDITKPTIDHTAIVFNYDQPLPEPQPPSVEEQILANTDATMLGVAGNIEETITVQQQQVKSDGDLQAVMLGIAGVMEEVLKLQAEVATLKGGQV